MRANKQTIALIKSFFFESMLRGYLGDAPRVDVPGMPGYRQIEFVEGDLRFLDRYTKYLGSHQSAGSVNIWIGETPVWIMNYSGGYRRSALPLLKTALRKTYVSKEFFAGRGIPHFTASSARGNLIYSNRVVEDSNFLHFESRESVREEWWVQGVPCGEFLGSQKVSGKLLLDVA